MSSNHQSHGGTVNAGTAPSTRARSMLGISTPVGMGGRFGLSVLLSVTFSISAVVVAWGLYIFSGSISWRV